MATMAQMAANRSNAQRSTGPRSEAGKQRSRGNAIRHGFFSQHVHCRNEQERAEFEAVRDRLVDELRPEGVLQQWYVEQAAVQIWKLRALQAAEGEWDEKRSGWEQRLIGLIARLVREVGRLQREAQRRSEQQEVRGPETASEPAMAAPAEKIDASEASAPPTTAAEAPNAVKTRNEPEWRPMADTRKAQRFEVLARAVDETMSTVGRREGKPMDHE